MKWAVIAAMLLAGCRADVASPPAATDEPFVCPPKRRCLFDTTSGTWRVMPDTCAAFWDMQTTAVYFGLLNVAGD